MSIHFKSGYAYQEIVAGDREQIPTILIHGAGSSHLGWPAAIRHLPEKHIFALDLPNHGKSAKKEIHTIEEYADDLHVFLLGLGIQRANLVGYSMGAALVLQLILQYPAFCKRGALLAYTPEPVFEELFSVAFKQDMNQSGWIQIFSEKLFSSGFSDSQREKISKPLLFENNETLKRDLLMTHQYRPVFPVGKISTPLLFLFGENDPFINQEQKQSLIDQTLDPMVKEIPDAGHLFIWEYPERIQKYLLEFLDCDSFYCR
ncbi:MAG: alpha/beta fold hydrolase [Anaerolineaceae bacterium]